MMVKTAEIVFSNRGTPRAYLFPRYRFPPSILTASSSVFHISIWVLYMRSILFPLPPSINKRIIILFQVINWRYMSNRRIFISCLLITVASCVLTYNKVTIKDESALFLDGSRGVYYLYEGDPKKVMLFLEGGGWCAGTTMSSTIQSCYSRSKTHLGSSTSYTDHISYSTGVLSDNEDNYYKNWTKIYMKYCDGAGHQGSRSQPVQYKDAKLYFRGQNITLATFDEINQKYGIFNGKVTHLVLSGGSAGGLATYHWTNHVQKQIKSPTKFWSSPDSGIFLDVVNVRSHQPNFRIGFENLLKYSNQETPTPIPECDKQNPTQLWRCMFVQYFYQHLTAPLFAINSLYDSYGLSSVQGISCINGTSLAACDDASRKVIEDYHQWTLSTLNKILEKSQNGAWSPACVNHVYSHNEKYNSPSYRIPMNSQFTLVQSVADWIEGKTTNSKHIDIGDWPANKPCSGYKDMYLTTE